MTRAPRRPRAASALLLVGIVGALACGANESASTTDAAVTPDDARTAVDSTARAPEGARVRVEVLNAGGVNGLARRATVALRDLGYDVVEYGTSADTSSVTRIRVTAATRAWGERVQRALGTGRIEEVEVLRYVDVVLLLGRDWTPAAQPFRP